MPSTITFRWAIQDTKSGLYVHHLKTTASSLDIDMLYGRRDIADRGLAEIRHAISIKPDLPALMGIPDPVFELVTVRVGLHPIGEEHAGTDSVCSSHV